MANLIERHRNDIRGVLSCLDRVVKTYKYYLTEFGRHVAIAGLTLKNLFLIPEFASAALAH